MMMAFKPETLYSGRAGSKTLKKQKDEIVSPYHRNKLEPEILLRKIKPIKYRTILPMKVT